MAIQLFEIQTDKIVNGTRLMNTNTNLTSWVGDLSSMTNSHQMFKECSNLTSFTGELSSLENGDNMFDWCENLTTFNADSSGSPVNLSSLTSGYAMFAHCTNLESFTSDLPSLTYGSKMFYRSGLNSFSSKLSSMTDGNHMFYNCENLTSFSSDLSSMTDGSGMFCDCENLTSFNADLSSLENGSWMFMGCKFDAPSVKNVALTINKNLTNNPRIDLGVDTAIISNEQVKKDIGLIKYKGWNVYTNNSNAASTYTLPKYAGCTTLAEIKAKDANCMTTDFVNGIWNEHLPDLVNGKEMFYNTGLNSFNGDLSSLTNGYQMFRMSYMTSFLPSLPSLTSGYCMFADCDNLTSFNSNLSSLQEADSMFYNCENLTSFSSDLPSLQNADSMFRNCHKLNSFNGDLSSLTDGVSMFYYCTALTSFNGDLSSLTDGFNMFTECKLDTPSVQNIANTINTHNGIIHISISDITPNTDKATAFNTIASKGWTVYVNGSSSSHIWNPTSLTPLDGEETTAPIPFYAKPVQSDEEHAHYTDSEGNYYNILGAQFIYGDDLSTYGMFINEEDAAANMRLTKIEK